MTVFPELPGPPDPDEFERPMWKAGNAALAAEGDDRDDLAKAAGMLAGLRDLAVLWRSGAPPDPGLPGPPVSR